MISSVAVLSDIHGVLPVLEAVLAESAVREADLVIVTGDIASGPQPVEVLDRLMAEGDRVRMIQGNAYRELVALRRGQEIEIPDDVTPWAAEQLREEHVQILEDLPHPLVLTVEGFGRVVFCHGSPRRCGARCCPGVTYPGRVAWANEYLRAVNSDADAIAAFTPKEDRPS